MHSRIATLRPASAQAGFTLIEMSVVLAIIAVLTAGMVSMGSSTIESVRRVSTRNKMNAVEDALTAFRLANNRLPCPADATLTDTAANSTTYGYEGVNAGACTTGSTYLSGARTVAANPGPTANYVYTVTGTGKPLNTTVAEGAVPVKTLNLPDEFDVDGWGRKFAYAVWTPLTAAATSTSSPAAFLNYGITPSCGAITVENAGGASRTSAAAYALISYGSNGHGGYLKNGTRYFMGTENNANEKTNCHCNATTDAGNYAATYVQADPDQTSSTDSYSAFDDIVRYKERWQMQDAYDTYSPYGSPCTPGFIINGATSFTNNVGGSGGEKVGLAVAVGDVNGDGIADLVIGAPLNTVSGNTQMGSVYVVFGTKSGFPDPLPLNSTELNGTNGFEMDGSTAWDNTGNALAVTDVNGDGIADIIIGANAAGVGHLGKVYVVFGKSGLGSGQPFTLASGAGKFLDGTNGVEFDGTVDHEYLGMGLAAGDVNGDGVNDIIIGAPAGTGGQYGAGPDAFYIIFGQKCGGGTLPACTTPAYNYGSKNTLNGAFMNGTNGAEYTQPSTNAVGYSLAVGDFNGDGIGDIAVGVPVINNNYKGGVYLILGHTAASYAWPASPTALTAGSNPLDGTHGTELDGSFGGGSPQQASETGFSLAAGDVNGDGVVDLVIGVVQASPTISHIGQAGEAYLIFGSKTTLLPSTTISTTNTSTCATVAATTGLVVGQTILSANIPPPSGTPTTISALGSACNNNGASCSGSTCITLSAAATGTASGTAMTISAMLLNSNLLNGVYAVEYDGAVANTYAGATVAVGDVNGDGVADILIGAHQNNTAGFGYLVFGQQCGGAGTACTSPNTLNAAFLNGINGVEFDGPAGAHVGGNASMGSTIFAIGDINGDGYNDLLMGANGTTVGGVANTGSVYVYYGKKQGWPTSAYALSGL